MKPVVLMPIFKLFSYPAADNEFQIRIDSDITIIKQSVNIGPEQETIICSMRAALTVVLDVGSFKGRARFFHWSQHIGDDRHQ